MLAKETRDLLDEVVKNWDKIKEENFPFKNSEEYCSEFESSIGKIWWNSPHLVWIFATNKEESYEGSQSQVGVTKEGKLMWQYQSHCSCNGYEDTTELGEQFTEKTLKEFDFTYTEPPLDWEVKMRNNMKLLLKK